MIVFCCVLPASNKARDDDDDGTCYCVISTQHILSICIARHNLREKTERNNCAIRGSQIQNKTNDWKPSLTQLNYFTVKLFDDDIESEVQNINMSSKRL